MTTFIYLFLTSSLTPSCGFLLIAYGSLADRLVGAQHLPVTAGGCIVQCRSEIIMELSHSLTDTSDWGQKRIL